MAATMEVPADKPCPNCIALELRVAALEAELAKARKNSANSSKASTAGPRRSGPAPSAVAVDDAPSTP